MIALMASALLGLYIFAPYVFFHRISSLFIRLKKFQRSKTEEIIVGIVVAGLPFLVTLALFSNGWIGQGLLLFRTPESTEQKISDYHAVFDAAYSESYFTAHEQSTWNALSRVYKRQADFLIWNYLFVLAETVCFILLTSYYWRLKNYKAYGWFASRVLLPAVSEWHILLTNFTFPPHEARSVKADIMSKDNILYRGDVEQPFLDATGDLSGLLLKNAQRFQYEKLKEDRKNNAAKAIEEYWTPIPEGGNFYLPSSNLASLNIRYTLPEIAFEHAILDAIKKLQIKGISNVNVKRLRRERP